ncbi:outer membrane beta-barrel protein [Erythrobacter sp. sf7]|uniref:Outer membrane beta-barrel protein n=1 Tax=Erythrobacter fulvus TaxID=2987523 RepID=A0ABT5JQN0_9SPHN|nr:outer membrane beta-barrel protein [Erythrobacter fulvus]MDC8753852.1 outer membrane beta-barrel protein [Erythrobacter fulvus]
MKFALCAAAVAAVSLATPAMAQDESEAGGNFHVGAIAGIDSVEFEVDNVSDNEADAVFGIAAGYDYQFASGLVLGVEGEWTDSSVGIAVDDVFALGDRLSLNAGRDLYVGVRGGYRIGSNGLIYGKLGYTNASAILAYNDGTGRVSEDDQLDGIRVGAGGEIGFGENFALRLEYRYSDYGEYDYAGINTGLNVSRHQGVAALVAKF